MRPLFERVHYSICSEKILPEFYGVRMVHLSDLHGALVRKEPQCDDKGYRKLPSGYGSYDRGYGRQRQRGNGKLSFLQICVCFRRIPEDILLSRDSN